MKTFRITLVTLALFAVACSEQPATGPEAPVMLAPGNGVRHRVFVGGHDLDVPKGDKNFSLIAIQSADGSVKGRYTDMFGAGTTTGGYHVDVDCLVVDGNQAWIGGIITNGSINGVDFTGQRALTRVVDNGKSANDLPDQISYSYKYPANDSPLRCTRKQGLPLFLMTDGQVTVD